MLRGFEQIQFDRLLVPSLQEINFQLTKTLIGDQNIQSLAYSVSIDKISSQVIKDKNQNNEGNEHSFNLQSKLIQVDDFKNYQEIKQTNKDTNSKKIKSNNYRKLSRNLQELKAKRLNLATTSSTIKNSSPTTKIGTLQLQEIIRNRTRKSITHKNRRQQKEQIKKNTKQNQKYAPYLQKLKVKKPQPKSDKIFMVKLVRGRFLSTRK